MAEAYPLPVFHFKVEAGTSNASFSEVAGLDIETEALEYRGGASPEFNKTKQPGMKKFGNITLKRGIVAGDNELYQWLNTTSFNQVERRDITISLLNENHEAVLVWKAKNVWPIKMTGPGLKADGNEIAIETVELAHEGLTIASA
jgi:phage tail-like protein